MKFLKIYAVADERSSLDILSKVVKNIGNATVSFEKNIEKAVSTFNQQSADLLVIDKAISTIDYNKLHKLAELIHPDAVLIALHFSDEDFIQYKLTDLMSKWKDAQTEKPPHFIDNPKMD